jgi:hypothetical protein
MLALQAVTTAEKNRAFENIILIRQDHVQLKSTNWCGLQGVGRPCGICNPYNLVDSPPHRREARSMCHYVWHGNGY